MWWTEIAANADKPGGTVVEMAAGPREPGVVDVVADQRTTGEEERKESDVIESEGLAESDALRRDLVVPSNWIDVSGDDANLRLCEIVYQQAGSSPPLVVARSLVVDSSSRTWRVHIHGHQLDPSLVPTLVTVPSTLNGSSTSLLLQQLNQLKTCAGNPDVRFVTLAESRKNGRFLSSDKAVVAYLDSSACVTVDGQEFPVTVRCSMCCLLTERVRCSECARYRKVLISTYHRAIQDLPTKRSVKVNYRFLKTPERLMALRRSRQTIRNRDRRILRMKKRLDELTLDSGVELEPEVQEEITGVIDTHGNTITGLPGSDFRKIFWDQQVAALKCKKRTNIRWHPLFVRWCLNISRVSPKAYEVMRESGLQLPTRRTLNDYTHWVSSEPGFQSEVDDLLVKEAEVEKLDDWQRYVVLIIDEMKIHEDLVYDRCGHLLGFVNLGDVNNQLLELEQCASTVETHEKVATQMLTLMVRGIFITLEFPYASFPTQGVTGELLYWVMWEGVRRLEQCNLKVISFVCDGAKPNRKFLKGLGCKEEMKEGVFYKTRNRYCRERYIYFISDVPHLVKTTRNCWFSSKSSGSRYMWRNGKHILWDHLCYLYEQTQTDSGLYIGHRLTYEHINLTSYSKMKVNLAAQVLSNSVSCAFEFLQKEEFMETAKFCRVFDRFFDCMNTRSLSEGRQKRKPDLEPYRSHKDSRLAWLESDFLAYLREWEDSVQAREGFSKEEQERMTLSRETLQGLKMTVCSFVEMARYLLQLKPGLFLFSERFNQDPLESFFGQQRAHGGRSDNPSATTFLQNAQAIRVQRTLAVGHGGNVQKQRRHWTEDTEALSRPLRKRPRRVLKYQTVTSKQSSSKT